MGDKKSTVDKSLVDAFKKGHAKAVGVTDTNEEGENVTRRPKLSDFAKKFTEGNAEMVSATNPNNKNIPLVKATTLESNDEVQYQKWKSSLPKRLQYEGDYDLRGYWKDNGGVKIPVNSDVHLPDTYKLPNHPTFSNESKYYNDNTKHLAGSWNGDKFIAPRRTPMSMQTMVSGASPEDVAKNMQYISQNFKKMVGSDVPAQDAMNAAATISNYDRELAQKHLQNELNANTDYVKNSVETLYKNQPEFIQKDLRRFGVDKDKVVERITDLNGNTDAIKAFVDARRQDIQNQYENEKNQIDPYNNKPVDYELTPEDEAVYKKSLGELNDRYKNDMAALNNSTFNLTAQKVINQKLQSGTPVSSINPYEIGAEIEKTLGDAEDVKKDEVRWRTFGKFDPAKKVNREIVGYRAMQVAQMGALASNNLPLAKELSEKTDDYAKKILDNNPEYKKQKMVELLSDEVYKDQNSLYTTITGYNPNEEDLKKAAERLGWTEEMIKDIKPEDLYRLPDVLTRVGRSFAEASSYPFSEMAIKHIINPIGRDFSDSPFFSKELEDERFNHNWYDNTEIGLQFGGKKPSEVNLIGDGTRIESNPASQNFLMNVSDDSKNWNISAGSIASVLYDGIGQIASYATGGGQIGSALKASNILKNVETADRVGLAMYGYITGYDRNKRAADEAIGNEPDSEAKKVLLANIYTLAEVLTEQILPDTKIAKNIFSGVAGKELVERIATNGLESLTKEDVKNLFVKGAKEFLKDDIKEGTEEALTVAGQALGDSIFAPNKYNSTDYKAQAVQQGIVGAISASIPVGAGSIAKVRSGGTLNNSIYTHVGENPELYINQVDKDLGAGKITQAEANQKIANIRRITQAVNNVPSSSVINNKPLSEAQKSDYAVNLFEEDLLKQQMDETTDEVQKNVLSNQIKELQTKRQSMLAEAGVPESEMQPAKSNAKGQAQDAVIANGTDINQQIVQNENSQPAGFENLDWNEETPIEDTVSAQPINNNNVNQTSTAPSSSSTGNVTANESPVFELKPVQYGTNNGRQLVFVDKGQLKVIDTKTREEVSPATYKRAVAEAARKYPFTRGTETVVPEDLSGSSFDNFVAENSTNPVELVTMFVNEEPIGQTLTGPEFAISTFGGFQTTNDSYNRWGDRNNMTLGKAKAYVNDQEGTSLDEAAREISDNTGIEVTPQDLVDFMDRFPNGVRQAERTELSPLAQSAAKRFQEITGFPLTPDIADEVLRQADILQKQQIALEKRQIEQLLKTEYENAEQLEDDFWRLVAENQVDWEAENGPVTNVDAQGEQNTFVDEGRQADTGQPAGGLQETGEADGIDQEAGDAGNNIVVQPEAVNPGVNAPIVIDETASKLFISAEDDVKDVKKPEAELSEYDKAIVNYNKFKDFAAKKESLLEKLEDAGKQNTEEFVKAKAAWRLYNTRMREAQRIIDRDNKKAVKEKADKVRSLKLKAPKPGTIYAATPIAAVVKITEVLGRNVYNAAIETVAQALEAGYGIKVAVQKGVDYVNDRWFTRWPEQDFVKLVGGEMSDGITANDVRALLDNDTGLTDKQRKNADYIVDQVINNNYTLRSAVEYMRTLPLADAARRNLIAYVKGRVNNDIFKLEGSQWADKMIAEANGDLKQAIDLLTQQMKERLLNAETLNERENIRNKAAGARTYIQSKMVDEGIMSGEIVPVYERQAEVIGDENKKKFELPKRTKKDVLQENVQDKAARLARAQESSVTPITTRNDALTAMRLRNSKAGYHIQNVRQWLGNNEFIKGSFFDRLKNAGIDIEQFGLYMYAKHAKERNLYNAQLREKIFEAKVYDLNQKIAVLESKREGADALSDDMLTSMGETLTDNADLLKYRDELNNILQQKDPRFVKMPDGGSGMTNAQADEILAEVKADGNTEKFQKFADEFRTNVIDKLLDFKFDTGVVDEKSYNHLKAFYENYVPLKVDNEADDGTGMPANSKRNGKDLYRSKGSVQKDYTQRSNPVLQAIEDLERSINISETNRVNKALANLVRDNPNEAVWEVQGAQYNVLKDKQGNVLYAPEINKPEGGIPFYEDGEKKYIILKDPGLLNIYKKVGSEKFNAAIQWPTRIFTAMNTLANPNFILKNPLIDVQDAAMSLNTQDNEEVSKNFRSYVKSAPKLVWQIFKGDGVDNEWKKWIDEWKQNGGEISFLSDITGDDQKKRTLDLFNNYGKPLSKSQAIHYINGVKRFASGLEQMTRVMAYRAAREAGIDKEKSALISRNATVDFERKGVYGSYINAFKAFANAGIQGGVNMGYAAIKSGKVRKFLGFMVIAGMAETVFNNLVGDCDDPTGENCYWEIPEYEKQKNYIAPLSVAGVGGEGHLRIPAGRQFAWFKYLGNNIAEVALGKKPVYKAMGDLTGAFLDFYNPVGGSAPIEQQLSGNLSPITQAATNKNSLGFKIVPDNENALPDAENYFPSTEKEYVAIADMMSKATGGSKGKAGLIDVSPGTIDWVANTLGGGVYNFAFQTYTSAKKLATGEEIKEKEKPFLSVFYRDNDMAKTKEKYYDLADESKTEIFDHAKQLEVKEVLDRLVDGGQITADQRGKRFNFIQRNQTTLRKNRDEAEGKSEEESSDNTGDTDNNEIVIPETDTENNE